MEILIYHSLKALQKRCNSLLIFVLELLYNGSTSRLLIKKSTIGEFCRVVWLKKSMALQYNIDNSDVPNHADYLGK